jgi:hypothetical protein
MALSTLVIRPASAVVQSMQRELVALGTPSGTWLKTLKAWNWNWALTRSVMAKFLEREASAK